MARIFSVLAILAVLLLAANFLLGLSIGDFNGAAKAKRESQNRLVELERQSRGSETRDSAQNKQAKEQVLAADEAFAGPRRRMTLHMLLGSAAGLMALLVSSVTVTYFIGTSRWCKEVVETYKLDSAIVRSSNRLKRRTFPWALLGMLAVVVVISLGAASDRATGRPNTQAWVSWHLVGAYLGTAFIAWTYVVAWNNIVANHAIINELVDKVAAVRRERGLSPHEGTLQAS